MRLSSPHPQLRKADGCVVSYCPTASAIGAKLLGQGGNAVDAAVGTALALAVSYPQAGNLGGGGFLLLKLPGAGVRHLDFREVSPAAVTGALFRSRHDTVQGALSVGVPGTIAGLAEVLERHGRLSWDRVVAPAIDLADKGVWITARQSGYLRLHHEMLESFASTRRYYTDAGAPLGPGTHFRQADLAATLRSLADRGPRELYEGQIARQIAAEIAAHGGVLDESDLAAYQPRWREPLSHRLFGAEVHTAAPPAVGGLVMLLATALAAGEGIAQQPVGSAARLNLFARAFRVAFALRRAYAGDPEHLPAGTLEEAARTLDRAARKGALSELEGEISGGLPDPTAARASTTHLCTFDPEGGAVSMTISLNTMFGSKLAVSGAGFLLNNSIDDFHIAEAQANWYELAAEEGNRIGPRRRPASSMAPTLVTSGDEVLLAIGGSGGPRIPTLISQALVSVLADEMPVSDALRVPRVHHQNLPDELAVERTLPAELVRAAGDLGFRTVEVPLLGIGAAIEHDPATGALDAALDHRLSVE